MKKILYIFLFFIFISLLAACNTEYTDSECETFVGKNGNWFVNGVDTNIKAKNDEGRETIFRIENGVLQWKYVDEEEWNILVIVESGIVQDEYTEGLILNEVTGRGYMVVGYDGDEENIIIPATYRGLEVFKIGDAAFANSNIKRIKIGKNVKYLGVDSFADSVSLEEVIFDVDSQLVEIGACSFYGCDNLETINVPNTLQKLGYCAFFLNDSLICEYDDIYGVKYIGSKENPFLILYDTVSTSVKKCIVNPKCRFINDYSFTYCSKLEKVSIPEGVVSIGSSAFYSCSALKSITIPSTVSYIGEATFNCADGLEEMIVSEDNIFYDSRGNCNGIIESKTNALAYGCKTTIIPEGILEIKDKAYYGNYGVESIYIPASVEKIGEYVFSMCTNLNSIEVSPNNSFFTSRDKNGNNCDVIIKKGSYTQTLLYGANGVDGKIIIPEGVTNIGVEAFRGRVGLTEITLPKTLSSISNNAFDYCKNLKVVNNASRLELTLKSNDHGGVAYYATTINKI